MMSDQRERVAEVFADLERDLLPFTHKFATRAAEKAILALLCPTDGDGCACPPSDDVCDPCPEHPLTDVVAVLSEHGFDAMQYPALVQDLADLCRPFPDEGGDLAFLRGEGWAVAIHNDYQFAGIAHTFWLFTKGERAVKGEGRTDAEALSRVRFRVLEVGP